MTYPLELERTQPHSTSLRSADAHYAPSLPWEGSTTAAVRALYGSLPTTRATSIAIVGCCAKEHFPFDEACRKFDAAHETIASSLAGWDCDIVRGDEPFESPQALLKFADGLLTKPLAGVIFIHSSYTAGEIGSHFGRWLAEHNIPVLSWSFPDERGGSMQANSLCCQNFVLNMWHRLGVRYAWMHESISAQAGPRLVQFFRSIRARNRLRHGKVLHAGGTRVTGFYDGELDELAVMRRFGLQFDRIDLQPVYELSQAIGSEEVEFVREALLRHPNCSTVDVPEPQVDKTLRFGLALYKLAVESGYLGCTVKSWPEMFTSYGCAIDGAVSLLNDAGVCTAEEGDMNALLTSLAMHELTRGAALPVTMDLSALNAQANRIGIWHCGACPTRWLRSGTFYEARKHSILENAGEPSKAFGLVLEFLLELGPATVARYQSPDAARMLSFEGMLKDTELAFRGSYCELEPKLSAASIMGTILSAGLDHHWCVGRGWFADDLAMLNHWLGIAPIEIVTHNWLGGLSL